MSCASTNKRKSTSYCRREKGSFKDRAEIVAVYVHEYRAVLARMLDGFRKQSHRAAVERAGMAQQPDGKRYEHQRRLTDGTLKDVRRLLLGTNLSLCRDFEGLIERIEKLISPVPGVGELMIYDTALRIGANLGLLPSRVYLHRGTRAGAKALGLSACSVSLDPRELPAEFKQLAPHEMEDCLCIFKDDF